MYGAVDRKLWCPPVQVPPAPRFSARVDDTFGLPGNVSFSLTLFASTGLPVS